MKRYLIAVVATVGLAGCSGGPSRVVAPKQDPSEVAAAAMEAYDTNSDGKIDAKEAKLTSLDPANGWDSDGDKAISLEELQTRLEHYERIKPGVMGLNCTVYYNNQPLPNAQVSFEPEEFLNGSIEAAEGTTGSNGEAQMLSPEILDKDPTLKGIRAGMYRVRITHDQAKIKPKYNEETTLFYELSPLDINPHAKFQLRR